MSELENKVVDILDKLESITVNYAPEVANAAIQVIRFEGIGVIFSGLILLIISVTTGVLAFKIGNYFMSKYKESGSPYYEDSGIAAYVIWMVAGALSVYIFGTSLEKLTDFWVWVAIFNPELAMAHKIMESML